MARARKKRKKPMGWRGQVLLLGLFLMAVVFLPTTILLFFGMMPTVVAAAFGQRRESSRTLTVGAMNFAGCFPFLLQLWTSDGSIEAAVAMLFDPRTMVVMYCAAAVGYLIDWAVSGMVGTLIVQQSKSRIEQIGKEQADMIERWGVEVSGEVALDARGFPIDDALPDPAKAKE